jgi:hypothetical protein
LWLDKQEDLIERERAKFIEQWKKEAREEQERKRWYRRCCRSAGSWLGDFRSEIVKYFRWGRFFIANLPPTVGAIALASANLGVDWFKFAEENMESCSPVHFHSAQCSFPEVRRYLPTLLQLHPLEPVSRCDCLSSLDASIATQMRQCTKSPYAFILLAACSLVCLRQASLPS